MIEDFSISASRASRASRVKNWKPLPDARTLLADLAHAGIQVRIYPARGELTWTAPTTLDPATRDNLLHELAATKPAWLAAARGLCARCHHQPAWCHDHDTGWPTCHPCARQLGTVRLAHEHPDRPDLWQTADP